jgi:hypothetical protein
MNTAFGVLFAFFDVLTIALMCPFDSRKAILKFWQLMYKTILVMLDGTQTDRAIISHIKRLAMLAESQVVLLHVADRWAARTFGPDAISPGITEDTAYEKRCGRFSICGDSRGGRIGLR